MENSVLHLAAGWVIVGFMAVIASVISFKMIVGGPNGIDLSYLISEENGQASLSRFQFLVFTFVIAMGLLVLTLKGTGFPQIDSSVFGLLGISGGSYVASKITQKAGNGNNNSPSNATSKTTQEPANNKSAS